ncbi:MULTISPECIES: deoxyribose-phosphate aldolase [Legionella]|uniref:deoxyribose-phosphate aldolase n=1 Tax=Legionella TaxID=445 RepID=UPI001F30C337|nr:MULTISPECIES: deoxyribose-phosphate aldolase [Legionella]MCP0913506.1 deoxyribose-phosphate aldolase [Legionella sp. 27cVA30]
MKLEQELTQYLEKILKNPMRSISAREIISVLDLTLLEEKAQPHAIENLAQIAVTHEVAAICVLPQHLHHIPATTGITRATVANFPAGDEVQEDVLKTIIQSIKLHADEIDYVFPYQNYLHGNQKLALQAVKENYELCKRHQVIFKVILETGAFPSMALIYEACLDILAQGCDFLKTSTGKTAQGATLSAAFTILSAIKESGKPCGIKLSGGVKTKEQALQYAALAEFMIGLPVNKTWFRLGASRLLDELLAAPTSS